MQRNYNNNRPALDMGVVLRFFALWIVFSVVSFGVKQVVLRALEVSPTNQVGNGMLTLYEVHNTGAAFNIFAGQPEMIIIASFLTIAIMSFIVIMFSSKISQTAISAMALLCSGISSNMFERLNHGYVIDYISCKFLHDFPIFNVPDIMIVCGALGLIIALFSKD